MDIYNTTNSITGTTAYRNATMPVIAADTTLWTSSGWEALNLYIWNGTNYAGPVRGYLGY